MNVIRAAASKLGDFVHSSSLSSLSSPSSASNLSKCLLPSSSHSHPDTDQLLLDAKSQLCSFIISVQSTHSQFISYSQQQIELVTSFTQLTMEYSQFMASSSSSSLSSSSSYPSLYLLCSNKLSPCSVSLYKDRYHHSLLSLFDSLESDLVAAVAEFNALDDLYSAHKKQEAVVFSYHQAKDKRASKGQSLTDEQQSIMKAAQQKAVDLSNASKRKRGEFIKNTEKLLKEREETINLLFSRLLEIEFEFTQTKLKYLKTLKEQIHNKSEQSGEKGRNENEHSHHHQPLKESEMELSSEQKEEMERFYSSEQRNPVKPTQRQSISSHSVSSRSSSPSHSRSNSRDSEDSASLNSSRRSSVESIDSETEKERERKEKKRENTGSTTNTGGTMDFLGFSDSSNSSSVPSSSPPPASVPTPLEDFFFGMPSQANGQKKTEKTQETKKSTPSSSPVINDLLFDFPSHAVSSSSSKSIHVSSSTPEHLNKKKQNPLQEFDPLKQTTATTGKTASVPVSVSASSSVSVSVSSAPIPTTSVSSHAAARAESVLSELRARDAAVAEEQAAKYVAEKAYDSQLSSWESKDGVKKNVRTLLSTLHTVLWPNSGWKQVSVADLLDFNAIKKVHRKAILLVHPDRLIDATPEQKVVAERLFDVLNTAFDRFQKTGQ